MMCVNEVGLNSFLKLKKLRMEHLEANSHQFNEVYEAFISQLKVNTSLTFVKLERVF